MIFKQLPIMISDLNKLGIALKSLDAMNIGSVGVNLANLEVYRTALKGLSVEQSVFALASKGATEEQIRQILVTNQATASEVESAMAKAGLTTATKALTQAEMVEMATKNGVVKAEAEALLSKIGITATEEGQVVVKKQVTLAMLEQAVASGTLTKAEASQIATMLGLNAVETANIGITNVLTASFTKLWAVITAHPIGAILTAIGAVAVGTIAYINKVNKDAEKALVEAHENAEKALEDTKTSLSDDKSELQSVNSELETTKERLKEISSIGAPTLTEQNELTKLSTANTQLETQKKLLENNIKLKQKSAALDAKELLGTQVEMEYSSILDSSSITSKKESYTYADHAKYQASNLKNAYNIYMKALEEGNVKRQELAQELIDASAGDTAELTSKLLEIVESFKYDDGTIIDGYEDIYNEYMGMIYNLQSLTNPDTFLDIAKSITVGTGVDYEKAISEAYALAYEGNFDVDNLNQDFVKALSDAGIDESTIDYIFSLKQKEYQLLVDKINNRYKVSEVPDKIKQDYWDANGNIHSEYVDVDEETKNRIEETNTINQSLNDYAKENPVEFQLVTSYDEGFTLLDKYIEEEKKKAENNTDYVGDYITNAITRIYDEAKVKSETFDDETDILSFDEAWGSLKNIEDSDSVLKNTRNDLEELANAGKLTNESFKNVTGFEEFLNMIGLSSKEIDIVVSKINSLADGADQLNSMNNGISGLSKNLGTKKESPKDAIDINTISGMDEALKSCTEEWENYVNVVGDASSTYDEVLKATNELATAYINSNNFLSNLTEENKDYYESQLKLMGIENASEVVKSALAKVTYEQAFAEEKLRIKSEDSATVEKAKSIIVSNLDSKTGQLTNTTYSQIAALIQEKGYTDLSKEAFFNLIISMDTFNGTGLDVNQKIGALKELIGWAYSAKAALEFESQTTVSNKGAIYSSATVSAEKAVENIQNRYNKNDVKLEAPIISPTSNSSGSDGSGGSGGSGSDSGSNTQEEIDWIEVRLESLQKKAEEVIDTIDKKVTLKQANKAINNSIKLTNTYLDSLEKAKEKYLRYFNEVDLPSAYAYKELIKNGKMDIQTITDGNLKTQIQKAQELWDKYQGCVDSIKEQKQQLKELNQMKLDKITEFYDKQQDLYDSSISTEESKIKYKEDAGIVVKESDYNTAINDAKKNENSRLKELNKFKKELDRQKKKGLRGSELKERQAELKQKYQDYYDSRSKRIELEQQQSDIALTKLQNERELLESNMNKWQSVIDLKEAQGKEITKKDYQKMITNAEKQNKSYEDQNKILLKQQKNVKKYSARWYELQGEINSNNDAIQKNIISMEEYSDSIDNIKLNKLERQLELLNSIHGIYSDILSFREAQGQDKNYSEYLEQIANNREEIKTLDAEIAEKDRLIASEDKENTVKIEELRKERAELESQRWNLKADNETLWKEAITSPLTDALDKISDELSDMNEKLNEQRDLEEAQYNLQKAQNQKNQLVLTKDGFKYQSDLDAVKEAQQKLDDIKYQKAIDKLEEIKEVIEKIAKESTIYDKNGNWIGYDDATLKKINSLILPVLNSNMYSDEQKNGLKNIVQELLNPKSDSVNSAINEKYTENASSVSKNDEMVLEKVQTPLLTSMENMANLISGNMLNIINTYSVAEKTLNSIHPKKINTATTFTGDIVIKESVDNVETFADAILKNLPNAVNRKLNKN